MQHPILEKLNSEQERKQPNFRVGDRINVSIRLKEGEKERVQSFRGVVISKRSKSGRGNLPTFTVRKVSAGIGVEKIFPLHSPFIEKIEIESTARVRRSRLYYLRNLKGRKARLKTSERFGEVVQTQAETATASAVETAAPAAETAPAPAPAKEKKDKKK